MFKMPFIPAPPPLPEHLHRQSWKLKTFHALCLGGQVHLFNQPDTVDEWLDRMYDQLHGAEE